MCSYVTLCGEISRKGAKLAKAVGFLCLFFVFLSATLSQRRWVLVYASPLLPFVSFVVNVLPYVVYFTHGVAGDHPQNKNL